MNERFRCCQIGSAPLRWGCFGWGWYDGGIFGDSDRAAWIRGDRAARYRERADHLKDMAGAETRPREERMCSNLPSSTSAWPTSWPVKGSGTSSQPLRGTKN
jgi:hypothetical protein